MRTFEPELIFEDNHLLVVCKPVGISVQDDQTDDADLLSLLKDWLKRKYDKPGNVFLGLVHRLDQPVSGVMVFAKTSKSASRLSEQVRNRSMKKIYLAVVEGKPTKQATLVHFLSKNEATNTVKVFDAPNGQAKEARLSYSVLAHEKQMSLVRVELETGRPHQIRVQFAHIGHPLVGDMKYGHGKAGTDIALFAHMLGFTHPTTKETLAFSRLPPASKWPWNTFNLAAAISV